MMIQSTKRRIYLADGSSVICTNSSSINISINKNQKNLWTLKFEDILIVPSLDRRLFSVNSFLNKGNNWVHFERNHIELGIYEEPRIKLPLSSLQSNAFVVAYGNKKKRQDHQNKEKKKAKISTNVLHDRFHRSDGAIADRKSVV